MDGIENGHISKLLEKITEEICDHYCKFPGQYAATYPDDDEETVVQRLWEERCMKCPLSKI